MIMMTNNYLPIIPITALFISNLVRGGYVHASRSDIFESNGLLKLPVFVDSVSEP
jgi:hypothetical protein